MKKINIFIFIVIILIAIFLSQKIFIFQDLSPTIIIENHKFQNNTVKDLYQGNKIYGEFTSKHNNLGIISVKFDTHWNINTDFLQFSIKEKGQSNWYYTNKYKVDQFQNKQYFPFGFPQIHDSKNKTYQIEIESLYGSKDNSVMPSPNHEPFLTKYNFPKNYLLQNKNIIPTFLFNKIGSFFRHVELTNYIFIFFTATIIFLFSKSKKGELLSQYFTKKTSGNTTQNPIFYWYFWTLGLIFLISFLIVLIKKHSETTEWLSYEITAIISFLALLKFNLFNKKIKPKTVKITLLISVLFIISQLIFFKFYLEIISWRYLIIACLALIPSFEYNNHSTENLLKILLINLLSIICVSAYFVLDIDTYSLTHFIILLCFIAILPFIIIKNNIFPNSLWTKIICPIILAIFIIFSVNKPIEYHHYSYYIGPAYEISQHKSILTQAPSQYGYLSIHFVKTLLSPFEINSNTFHQLNVLLYALYFICIYLIFIKITSSIFPATLFSIIAIAFQPIFSTDGAVLYPSAGPLRFGIGILIILITQYFKKNNKFFIPTLLASIAFFWSIETAIYIIPAWIFAVICQNYIDHKKIFKHLGTLFGFSIIIFTIIFIFEWNHIKSLPNLTNYFQFANAFKDGYGSELISKFGNFYIAVIILLLGLTTSIFITVNKIKNDLTLSLNFIVIHNIALFSYYVSRSNPSNLINISIFLLIETVIIYKTVKPIFFKKNPKILIKLIIFPLTLFITFFGLKCLDNIIHPDNYHHSVQETPLIIESYKTLIQKYNLTPNNVLIISKDNSTQIITEFKINTILPLNPNTMTILLPHYQSKYLIPNIDKISIGTTLVYTKDMPELITFFNQHFTLKPVLQSDKNIFFDLFILENK